MGSHGYAGLPEAYPLGASYLEFFFPPDPEVGSISGAEAQKVLKEKFDLPSEIKKAEVEDFVFFQASDGAQVIVARDDWNNFDHRTAVCRYFHVGEGCPVFRTFLKLGKYGAVLVPNWHMAGVNGKKLYHP